MVSASEVKYEFRREDTGEIVEVDFEKMMEQDAAGYIVLDDGASARRVMSPPKKATERQDGNANHKPPVSDAMGFTCHQLADFEEDRVRNGFHGVEFKPDPMCPEFYQVHCSSMSVYEDYMAHRGMYQKGRTKGNSLSEKQLRDAEEMANRLY